MPTAIARLPLIKPAILAPILLWPAVILLAVVRPAAAVTMVPAAVGKPAVLLVAADPLPSTIADATVVFPAAKVPPIADPFAATAAARILGIDALSYLASQSKLCPFVAESP